MKRIGEVETEKYSLTVYECDCGFHIGLDNTYMDQVSEVYMECPSCGEWFDTEEVNTVDDEIDMVESVGC